MGTAQSPADDATQVETVVVGQTSQRAAGIALYNTMMKRERKKKIINFRTAVENQVAAVLLLLGIIHIITINLKK